MNPLPDQSAFVREFKRIGSPVLYWHAENDGPPVAAIVDPDWLAAVWEAATGDGGYADPSLTDAGREARFMPHEHSEPEDRKPASDEEGER